MYTETLDDLQTLEGAREPSPCKIYFAPITHFGTTPGWRQVLESTDTQANATRHDDWVLSGSYEWMEFDDLLMESDFSEKQEHSDAGSLWKVQLTGILNCDDTDTRAALLRSMVRHRWMVRVHNGDGVLRMMGSELSGCDFACEYSAKDGRWSFTFSWMSEEPCLYVNGWS